MTARPRVLFLCTHNAARSQMAEALLRRHGGDRFEVVSAGLEPTQVHPLTHEVLAEIGVDTTGLRAKGLKEFFGRTSVHYAIVVCAEGEESCPRLYPFANRTLFWPIEDPAPDEGSTQSPVERFRSTRDQIDGRIRAWLEEPSA